MARRLPVLKTYKLAIGGKFPRGESGRVLAARTLDQRAHLANYCAASRKDFRDAVVAARKAQPAWAQATPYLRGQILYRAAEITETRRAELEHELARAGVRRAEREVEAAIDRLIYYAGWTDKFAALFGSVNPVSTPHFNFTTPEPTGVVAILAPDTPALLGMISLLAAVILSGNSAVLLAGETVPLVAISFAEILATSDLPPGVVNILTGSRVELAPHFAGHLDLNAIVDGSGDRAVESVLRNGTAVNLKRYARRALSTNDWFREKGEDPYWIAETVEMKTAWHPVGV